jgi:hypothetical protein
MQHYVIKYVGELLQVVGFLNDTHVSSTNKIHATQTTQWPKEKVQKDKQRSTNHTYQAKRMNTACIKAWQTNTTLLN